jgi:hypothetical protein
MGSARDPLTVGRNPQVLGYDQKYGLPTDRVGERSIGHGPVPYDNPDPTSPDRGGIIHIYRHDAFRNSTSRSGSYYYESYSSDGGTFQNNRRQDFNYDADGNVTHTPSYNYVGGSLVSFRDWTYDAAGRMSQVKETVTANNSVSTYISNHDGDGQPIIEYYQENLASKSYMLRSSVLGGKVLTRLDNAGNKSSTVFGVDGLLTVVQNVSSYGSFLRWTHIDPLGLSEAGDTKPVFDPMGNDIVWQHAPTATPDAYPPIAASFGGLGPSFGYAINSSCILDGIPTDCSLALQMLNHGSAEQCPNNYCGASRARNGDLVPLTRDPDTGLLGYYSLPPQNTKGTQISAPIGGVDKLKSIVVKTLAFGDCRKALEAIISRIAQDTGVAASHTDFLDLFNGITSQTRGGGLYVDVPQERMDDYIPAAARLTGPQPAGGGGLSWFFYSSGQRQRISVVFLMGAYNNSANLAFERIPFQYAQRAVHELVHNAPNDSSRLGRLYEHDEMNAAARELGSTGFDQYVKDHCIPAKDW